MDKNLKIEEVKTAAWLSRPKISMRKCPMEAIDQERITKAENTMPLP
jgi:hypothetical protein